MKSCMVVFIIVSMICSVSRAVLDIGYETDNQSLTISGDTVSTNTMRLGYKGNHNEFSVENGATVNNDISYIGWTSYELYYGDGIPAIGNQGRVSDATWNAGSLFVGFGPGAQDNKLIVEKGGEVNVTSCLIGCYAGNGNRIEISGPDSKMTSTGVGEYSGFVIGYRGGGHGLAVSGGASLTTASAIIGYGHNVYECKNNFAEVFGKDSRWHTGDLVVGTGPYAEGSRLDISDEGQVHSGSALIESLGNTGNGVTVSGAKSKWIIDGLLTLRTEYLADSSQLTIGNGAEVETDRLEIFYDEDSDGNRSLVNLNAGGTLSVRSDFDAAQDGFNFNEGSTLKVGGELSNLGEVMSGRRLIASDVLGNLAVNGTFSVDEDSTVSGNLLVGDDGTIEMIISSSDSHQLTVSGNADLSGKLFLILDENYSPANGTLVQLFNWQGGVSGDFSTVTSTALNTGLYWDTSALADFGQLQVVPEPGTATLLSVAGAGLFLIRSRRRRYETCRYYRQWRHSGIRIPSQVEW